MTGDNEHQETTTTAKPAVASPSTDNSNNPSTRTTSSSISTKPTISVQAPTILANIKSKTSLGPSLSNSGIRYNRIFKKTSQDGNLVLFLPQREIMITEHKVESLMGVALAHESVLNVAGNRLYLQVVLVFRYGREDEELMGLRFCNEIVIAADQIYPSNQVDIKRNGKFLTNAQGFVAIPFALDMGFSAPPSVRLLPCRPYNGAPIGTIYEVQLFASRNPEELPKKRKMVQMSMRLYESLPTELPGRSIVTMEKNFVFSESNLFAQAKLDSGVYAESDTINVCLCIRRPGGHGVKRIRITAIQQVSVAMFSTGNFKNNVGSTVEDLDPSDSCHKSSYNLKIELNKDFSWVAMDETAKRDVDMKHLAPSVIHANKSMFIIRVNYFVHILLTLGMLQRDISIKLPFILKRTTTCTEKPAKKSTTTPP